VELVNFELAKSKTLGGSSIRFWRELLTSLELYEQFISFQEQVKNFRTEDRFWVTKKKDRTIELRGNKRYGTMRTSVALALGFLGSGGGVTLFCAFSTAV